MSPDRKRAIRESVDKFMREAAHADFSNRISDAIEMASKAGLSDEEIIEHTHKALRKYAHKKRAVIFNRRGSS